MNNVNLAVASNAIIVGFKREAAEKVGEMADREGVDIRYYSSSTRRSRTSRLP